MENNSLELPATRFLQRSKRDWQLLCISVLAVATFGIGLAVFGLLKVGIAGWDLQDYSAFVPPLLYAFVSLILIITFYVAQRQGIMAALQQELVHLKIESELNKELALLDPITEVYNRRYLRSLLLKEVSRAKRHASPLSVIMFEVVGFRRVNDSLGHTGGDVVLRQIAQLTQKLIRNSDYVIRFGGHEFLLLLPDTNDEAAGLLGVRLQRAMKEWIEQRGMGEFDLKLAVGAASLEGDQSVEDVLKTADRRMREARSGRPELSVSSVPASTRAAASK